MTRFERAVIEAIRGLHGELNGDLGLPRPSARVAAAL
jgi:hypothetical protein